LIAHLAWDLDSNIVEADSGVGRVDKSGISSDNTVVGGLGDGDSGYDGLGDGGGVDSGDCVSVVDKGGAVNRVDWSVDTGVEESWISLGLSLSVVDCGSNSVDDWGVDSVDTSISVDSGDSSDSLDSGDSSDSFDSGDGGDSWDCVGNRV